MATTLEILNELTWATVEHKEFKISKSVATVHHDTVKEKLALPTTQITLMKLIYSVSLHALRNCI